MLDLKSIFEIEIIFLLKTYTHTHTHTHKTKYISLKKIKYVVII
jgi:hypothetical protein